MFMQKSHHRTLFDSFLNLSAPVLNFSRDKGKIFTFKPAQKSAGSVINVNKKQKILIFLKKCLIPHCSHSSNPPLIILLIHWELVKWICRLFL
jgi:hypothetical protein